MGKVLVLYHSAGGNTAAMARPVADGAGLIPGTEVHFRAVAEATPAEIDWCDGLAAGDQPVVGRVGRGGRVERFGEGEFDLRHLPAGRHRRKRSSRHARTRKLVRVPKSRRTGPTRGAITPPRRTGRPRRTIAPTAGGFSSRVQRITFPAKSDGSWIQSISNIWSRGSRPLRSN
jgi:hypothetical protein